MNLPQSISYNQSQIHNFQAKNAEETFLGPVNLLGTVLTESFANNTASLKNEIEYFKALQYIKYRLSLSIEQNNKILHWNLLYVRLRNRLTVSNRGLVHECYKRSVVMHDSTREYDDYISEGYSALMHAVDTFDPWMGFRFSTFGYTCISRAMRKSSQKKIRSHVDVYDVDPTMDENDEDTGYYLERVASAMFLLTEQERQILHDRFHTNKTLSDIGLEHNRSKERIRQIESAALKKLRNIIG